MTSMQAEEAGMVRLTEESRPGDVVKTVRGDVDFLAWCESEAARVRAAGRRAEVIRGTNGKCCVFVEPVEKQA